MVYILLENLDIKNKHLMLGQLTITCPRRRCITTITNALESARSSEKLRKKQFREIFLVSAWLPLNAKSRYEVTFILVFFSNSF